MSDITMKYLPAHSGLFFQVQVSWGPVPVHVQTILVVSWVLAGNFGTEPALHTTVNKSPVFPSLFGSTLLAEFAGWIWVFHSWVWLVAWHFSAEMTDHYQTIIFSLNLQAGPNSVISSRVQGVWSSLLFLAKNNCLNRKIIYQTYIYHVEVILDWISRKQWWRDLTLELFNGI